LLPLRKYNKNFAKVKSLEGFLIIFKYKKLIKNHIQMFSSKKSQLGIIEFKFFFIGLIAGIVLTLVIIILANKGIIPISLDFLGPGAPPQ
jgi:uncharacterized protein YacL